jgi:NAD(P)-dependent dehydrogenase (short-subunit alcohol dehydrogenase family)
VRANCVLPAIIDTPQNRAAMPRADHSKWTPPEAIASLIAFLLSPRSAPLTGGLLPADGPLPRA